MKFHGGSARASATIAAILTAVALLLPAYPAPAGQATLSWDPSPETDLGGYRIHYGETSGGYTVHVDVGNLTTHVVTGLLESRKYFFAATAYDSYGNESGYSNEVVYSVPDIDLAGNGDFGGVPFPGGALAQTFTIRNLGTAALNLTGTAPVTVSGANASDFAVTAQPGSQVAPGGSVTFQVTFTPSAAGSRSATLSIASGDPDENPYTFAVQGSGASETLAAPGAPGGPSSGYTLASYAYTAGGASSSFGDGVQYQFDWGDGTTSVWLAIGMPSALKSWGSAGTYQVKVRARCATHTTVVSEWSPALAVVIVNDPTPPAAPRGLRLSSAQGSQVTLAWDPVLDPSLAGYRIHYGTASGQYQTAFDAGFMTAVTLGGLDLLSVHYFAVTALGVGGRESAFSNEVAYDPGSLPLFGEDFSLNGLGGNPDWRVMAGKWSVNASQQLVSAPDTRNVIVVTNPAATGFATGRIESLIKLSGQYAVTANAAIIFGYRKNEGYRFVRLTSAGIVIGQAGSGSLETSGVKARFRQPMETGRWYHLRADIQENGLVSVYLDQGADPVATYIFAGTQTGKVGYQTGKSKAFFDEFSIWDAGILQNP